MLEITRNGEIINNKYFKSNDYFVHIDGKRFDQLSPILFSSPFLQKKNLNFSPNSHRVPFARTALAFVQSESLCNCER